MDWNWSSIYWKRTYRRMVELKIKDCHECPFEGSSGAFTYTGAKPVCDHGLATQIRGVGKKDPYHWHHRILKENGKIPEWCPIKLINEGKLAA